MSSELNELGQQALAAVAASVARRRTAREMPAARV
jgi:hypothetical protein